MVGKLVTAVGKYALKKAGGKTAKKLIKPLDRIDYEIFGIKPLNVG